MKALPTTAGSMAGAREQAVTLRSANRQRHGGFEGWDLNPRCAQLSGGSQSPCPHLSASTIVLSACAPVSVTLMWLPCHCDVGIQPRRARTRPLTEPGQPHEGPLFEAISCRAFSRPAHASVCGTWSAPGYAPRDGGVSPKTTHTLVTNWLRGMASNHRPDG